LLGQTELTVAEMQEILAMGQSRISTHLAQLRQTGLVIDRRAGKNIYYGIVPNSTQKPWFALMEESAGEIAETARDDRALGLVLKKRQDTAREYFDKLAGRFGRSYCPGRSWQGLSHLLLTLVPRIVVADLGAGEGTLSQLLARHAEQVIAVDNSEKMVEFGATVARENGFTNLEYRHGDIEAPPIDPSSIDLAILSQALHHASSPQLALQAAHRILKPGGKLLILDLLAHNFEQARELYADLWLGFGEAELLEMLEQAGFRNAEISVVSKEAEAPHFQTLLASAVRP
jgi:ArsR family transcriptional regulator